MRSITLSILTLMLMSTSTFSQVAMLGFGTESCGSWTEVRRAGPVASVGQKSWMLGFVSGVNAAASASLQKPDFLKGKDANALTGWIDNYCAAHPLDNLAGATIHLLTELNK